MRWSPLRRPRRACRGASPALDEEHETRRVAEVAVGVLTVDAMVFVLPAVGARLRGSTFPSFPLRDSGSPFPIFGHCVSTSGRARPKKSPRQMPIRGGDGASPTHRILTRNV